ncbi:hypothetical protein O3G_MSEX011762 [Manduca sexta]|uniref:Uncharacterized protein n=1 Tax=Manduca sexta TaxID=7130 RepID=A0A921ZLT6_MANSE|nr:hypothetical protein O3G_MSEX011762 [Manduca sexta]
MNQQESSMRFLKAFDPFAILEPEKVALPINPGTKLDNFGSLLTVKKDADVVDVFDNLFVTPQQVTRQSTNFDKELTEFLDKYEEGKVGKLIDISDATEKPENFLDESIKILEPKLDLLDDVDAIEKPKNFLDESIKILEPKLHLLDELDEDSIDELILNKSIESNRLKEISVKNSLVTNVSQIDFPEVKRESLNNETSEIKITNSKIEITTPINSKIRTPNIMKNEQIRIIEVPKVIKEEIGQISKNSSKSATELFDKVVIETVSKDPKVFRKQRIVKPEKEILKYTKGADLNEKRIVLPQIMERLRRRKFIYETKENLPKKLILDTGKTVTSKVYDSPKEMSPRDIRLKKTEEYFNKQQIGSLSVNLQRDGSTGPSTSKTICEKSKTDLCASCSEIKKVPDYSTKQLEREILLAMISKKIDGTSQDTSNNQNVLSPILLMEDCNKQRLTEFKKRQLFENFIRNGKM